MGTGRRFGGLVTACALIAASVGVEGAQPAAAPDAVMAAVMRGDREAVRAQLEAGAGVDVAQGDGTTPLHWAVRAGDIETARILLEAGANVRAATRLGGYTPLLLASRGGHGPLVALLLTHGAHPQASTTAGATALMLAARAGSVPAVQHLLAAGADVNAAEPVKGTTPLMLAAAAGRTEVVRALAAAGADLERTTTPIDMEAFERAEQERRRRTQGPAQGARRGADPRARGGIDRQYTYSELVGHWGGLGALHLAARQGRADTVAALVDAHANVNRRSPGDGVTPLLVAIINGHFDIARYLLDHGADVTLAQENGVTPLYAVLNCEWAAKAQYPQPRAQGQQRTSYLDLMEMLLARGADPNARLRKKVWYSQYAFDNSGLDEAGATPFWRAAYAADVAGMTLLVEHGADSHIPTMRTPGRPRVGDVGARQVDDVSGRPPVIIGGPGIPPLLAASGQGYGEGFAANRHRFAPGGMLAAVKYLVEALHADVNARDHEGNTALHNAAARGDNEMIRYLVSKGADPTAVNRAGQTTVDMANGPVQRISPFPETIALLERLGAVNNHHCVSC